MQLTRGVELIGQFQNLSVQRVDILILEDGPLSQEPQLVCHGGEYLGKASFQDSECLKECCFYRLFCYRRGGTELFILVMFIARPDHHIILCLAPFKWPAAFAANDLIPGVPGGEKFHGSVHHLFPALGGIVEPALELPRIQIVVPDGELDTRGL